MRCRSAHLCQTSTKLTLHISKRPWSQHRIIAVDVGGRLQVRTSLISRQLLHGTEQALDVEEHWARVVVTISRESR
jgi:hypothetical protein